MSGQAIPPARLNLLAPQVQDEWYQSLLKEVIAASVRTDLLDIVLSTTPLKPFKKSADVAIAATGIGPLPTDYNRYIAVFQRVKITYSGTTGTITPHVRPVDIVSETEFARRQGSILTRADAQPFGKITATSLQVVPYDIGTIRLEYFRPPATPYMDWCQSAANPNRIIYMPVGSKLTGTSPTFDLIMETSSGEQVIEASVTKTGGANGYVSRTVEYEWETMYHEKFVYFMLSKMGINLSEIEVAKYALEMAKQ